MDGEQGRRNGLQAGVGLSYREKGFVARLTYRAEYQDESTADGWFAGLQAVF